MWAGIAIGERAIYAMQFESGLGAVFGGSGS